MLDPIRESGRNHPIGGLWLVAAVSYALIFIAAYSIWHMPREGRTRDEIVFTAVLGASVLFGAIATLRGIRRRRRGIRPKFSGLGRALSVTLIAFGAGANAAPDFVRDLIFAGVSGAVGVITPTTIVWLKRQPPP